MATIEAVARDTSAPQGSLRLTLARVLLTPLCAVLIALISFRDFLAAAIGDDWVPRIQLHLQFNSLPFLVIFLPCTFVLYALYRRTAFANWILTLAGLAFYATAGLIYLVPLVFTCVFDYAVGAYLARADDERRRRIAFAASVAVQLSLLCTFKYAGWLSSELAGLFAALGLGLTVAPLALPLPPGISFYTFHTISYTADIYQRKFQPRGRLIDYITFVGFFPQLIAGPIARASELLPQVAATRPIVSAAQAEEAFWLIAWGLFKKISLADNFGLVVGQATADLAHPHHGGVGYVFMIAFAGQIYCDFSAYTDIARGVAKLFGLELPRNFLTPYFATSPSEFWQRWHVSLSRWLRDYLYIPLGGEREGRLKTLRNLAITMFLGGLWHGAGFGFIVWGLYHGALLVLYRLLPIDDILRRHFKSAGHGLAVLVMFAFVCIGWIFFRAPSGDLAPLFASLVYFPPFSLRLLLLGAVVIATEFIGYRNDSEFVDLYPSAPWWLRGLLLVAAFYGIVFFGALEQNEFIYFQF
ncbi:MAG TPA: MBOAT family O-acyltransferase [Xanthobacteraceae bacterium]|jgi:D-alanyl-lipoteichoic acid acyltransferase DltB (MBOAT superfamily)|nr:MBOAT family O-acyltransferase [Xanthobacteraceae bacterium]